MKKTIIPILVFFLAVVCMAYRLKEQDKKLKDKDRQIENLEAELTEARIVMVYDSLQMSIQMVQNYTKDEVKEKMPETTILIEKIFLQ